MPRFSITLASALAAVLSLTLAGARAADDPASLLESRPLPEYMLPSERAAEAEKKPEVVLPDEPAEVRLTVGRVDVIRLPAEGVTIISSSPEIVELHIEGGTMLFVIGRELGETTVVVADGALNPIWHAKVQVVRPEMLDDKTKPVLHGEG